ncbi:MAG: PPOX class F420-dependent oxidoreductase [Acidimicrobiales bacterium]
MDMSQTLEWASTRTHAVLVTLRRDGRAQSSDVVYAVLDGTICISLTARRAKTHNMRRDPRVVLHITDPGSWSYASIDAQAELSVVASAPDDAVVDDLVRVYRAVTGDEHPDWDEFRAAMVAEGRLVARIHPRSATGQIH